MPETKVTPAKKASSKTSETKKSAIKPAAKVAVKTTKTVKKVEKPEEKKVAPKKESVKKPVAMKNEKVAKPAAAKVTKPTKATKAKAVVMMISEEQRYRMIAEAAYYRAERNHFRSDHVRDWIEAERDIDTLIGGE